MELKLHLNKSRFILADFQEILYTDHLAKYLNLPSISLLFEKQDYIMRKLFLFCII